MSIERIYKINSKGLAHPDLVEFGQYIYLFKQSIGENYGRFDWDDINFKNLCKKHKIQPKGTRLIKEKHNHFWFSANKTNKGNDIAHHFLRHIRNAFAHGNITIIKDGKSKTKYFLIQDFDIKNDGTVTQTMQGRIRYDLLWMMITTLYGTLKYP